MADDTIPFVTGIEITLFKSDGREIGTYNLNKVAQIAPIGDSYCVIHTTNGDSIFLDIGADLVEEAHEILREHHRNQNIKIDMHVDGENNNITYSVYAFIEPPANDTLPFDKSPLPRRPDGTNDPVGFESLTGHNALVRILYNTNAYIAYYHNGALVSIDEAEGDRSSTLLSIEHEKPRKSRKITLPLFIQEMEALQNRIEAFCMDTADDTASDVVVLTNITHGQRDYNASVDVFVLSFATWAAEGKPTFDEYQRAPGPERAPRPKPFNLSRANPAPQ